MSCSDCMSFTTSALKLVNKLRLRADGSTAPLPVSGSIELTLRCNVRCKHCYILYPGATSDEMDTAQMKSVLKKLADGGALLLLMTGGEVLARPDFREIYLYAKELGLIPSLFTNGTLVNEDIVEFWKQYPPRRIEITIYGHTEETYEAVTGVKGSFKRFRRGVELIREAGLPLLLKTMVLKTNHHEFREIRQWVMDQGLQFRYDVNLTPKLNGDFSPLGERLSPREHVEIESVDFEENLGDFGLKLQKGMELDVRDDLFTCGSGIRTFHVDPQGRLHPCMLWRKNPFDLLNRELDDGWRQHVHDLRAQKTTEVGCNSCSNRGACGRCSAAALLEMGDPTKSIPHFCEVSQERRKRFGEPRSLALDIV
jgi:radical SAM protein with 4Fe4S-binding SPASM domain